MKVTKVLARRNDPGTICKATGDRYLVDESPILEWIGWANHVATWNGGSWDYELPACDDRIYVTNERRLIQFAGCSYHDVMVDCDPPVFEVSVDYEGAAARIAGDIVCGLDQRLREISSALAGGNPLDAACGLPGSLGQHVRVQDHILAEETSRVACALEAQTDEIRTLGEGVTRLAEMAARSASSADELLRRKIADAEARVESKGVVERFLTGTRVWNKITGEGPYAVISVANTRFWREVPAEPESIALDDTAERRFGQRPVSRGPWRTIDVDRTCVVQDASGVLLSIPEAVLTPEAPAEPERRSRLVPAAALLAVLAAVGGAAAHLLGLV